jgi:hypothetical protein
MQKVYNAKYLTHSTMPIGCDTGTLVIVSEDNHKNFLGKTKTKTVETFAQPDLYVCKECGLLSHVLSKEALRLIK